MTHIDLTLHERRLAAALASKGISSEPIYRAVLAMIDKMQLNGELLEFGAGTGKLAGSINASYFKGTVSCADILPRPVDLPEPIRWIQADLNHPLPVSDRSFDVIVSTEVIEHLENPRAAFREFNRMLRTGGMLILTTPNQESIRAYVSFLFGGHFVVFRDSCYPAHITALLRKDFERICHETEFDSPQFVSDHYPQIVLDTAFGS